MRRKNYWRFLLFFILSCSSDVTQARKHSSFRFTAREGLAGDNVYYIVQDRDGFLWIATETGVSRFDGTAFQNYTVKEGLPSNDINSLYLDKKGRLWMSPFKKDICYYYRGRIYNTRNDSLLRGIRFASEIKGFNEDAQGNILITSPFEAIYIGTGNSRAIYPLPFTGKGFFNPLPKGTGHLPIELVKSGLRKYGIRSFDYLVYPALRPWEPHAEIALTVDWNGRSLALFREGTLSKIIRPLPNIISYAPLTPPNILLNTAAGSYIYDIEAGKAIDTLLTGIAVNIGLIDRDSGIWLGTGGAGLYYFPPAAGKPVSDKAEQVYHFYVRNQELWIGSNNWQFWKLNKDRSSFERKIKPGEIDPGFLYLPEGNTHRLPFNGMLKLLTEQKGIFKTHNYYKSLSTAQDTFIMATQNGFLFKLQPPDQVLDSVYIGQRLTSVYYRKGAYYAGTLNGLYFVPGGYSTYIVEQKQPLVRGSISAIAYSHTNDLLWVATAENGVYCLRNNRIVRTFNETSGLTSPICKCLFTDGSKIYVGTVEGLNIIDPERGFHIEKYTLLDGLPSNNINCIYAENNQVWAGTSEGLALIDAGKVRAKPFFRLSLTDVIASGKERPFYSGNILLPPGDNNIRFAYSGISFPSMGNIRYTYRLKGLDDSWQQTREQYLQYPSLPPGTYTLELFATNRFDARSNMIRFTFTIEKKWWRHGWVQLPAILLFLALCYFALWWRTRRVQRRRQEKLELKSRIIELEQMALRAQMNPHFIFNSLNSFYQYVMDKDLEGASKFIQDFSRLLRLLFETAALPAISLDKELEFLTTYLELERRKLSEAFSYHLEVAPDMPTEELVIPSFVIQPFVENSIRHGIQNRKDKKGLITLSVSIEAGHLVITVTDNGVGRQYTEALKQRTIAIHRSRGIALTAERIALYNQSQHSSVQFEIVDLYNDGRATGTTVRFYFPLNHPI